VRKNMKGLVGGLGPPPPLKSGPAARGVAGQGVQGSGPLARIRVTYEPLFRHRLVRPIKPARSKRRVNPIGLISEASIHRTWAKAVTLKELK